MNIYLDSLHLLLVIGFTVVVMLYYQEKSHHNRTKEYLVNVLEQNGLIEYEEEE